MANKLFEKCNKTRNFVLILGQTLWEYRQSWMSFTHAFKQTMWGLQISTVAIQGGYKDDKFLRQMLLSGT